MAFDIFTHPTRRRWLQLAGAAFTGLGSGWLGGCGSPGGAAPAVETETPLGLPPLDHAALLDDLERRSFNYFWETADPATGLVPDRWPTPSFASVAAVGFALSAYPIGVARGWVTREQAAQRTLVTLRFFASAPQGPAASGVAGHMGFFYHFLDMKTGTRFGQVELSTVDTALLLAGALHAQMFFDGASANEAEIRQLAETLYAAVQWPWAQVRPPSIGHGWRPESGHIPSDWKGYNESMLVYLLALGSPTAGLVRVDQHLRP